MAYSVELSESADRELGKLDAQHRRRILKFLHERVARLDDPRSVGEALHVSQLGEFWTWSSGRVVGLEAASDAPRAASFVPHGAQRSSKALAGPSHSAQNLGHADSR